MKKFPWLLSACVGFLSLSQEILWMRYVGFANLMVPKAFTFVLTFFLCGIAFGAQRGKNLCNHSYRLYTASGLILIGAGALDMLGPLAASRVPRATAVAVPLIYLCAMLKGIIFPVAHHLGAVTEPGKAGKSISRVYFMNIVGATLGPLITGFWLLDHAGLQASMLLMGFLTVLLGIACLTREASRSLIVAACLVCLPLAALFALPSQTVERMACREADGSTEKMAVARVIETKSGIIHTLAAKDGGDYTLGGNVYDGRENIDPRVNSNILERLFVLAALQPKPENILVIGMSSGAWTRILEGFPGMKNLDIVEINPGYLDLIRANPDIAPLLKDPRVHLHIDDGRRWLKRNPGGKFDLIVMNTTFFWRAYSTNLLSSEFLTMLKTRLNQGGILAYNSTESPDALKTAEEVFLFAFRYMSFVVASDRDFRPAEKTGKENLLRITRDGKPVLDSKNAADMAFISKTLGEPFKTSADMVAAGERAGDLITDWNMITEFRHGPPLLAACAGH